MPTLLISALAVGPAQAALVTWYVTGTVTQIGIYPEEMSSLGVDVGTPFTASFTYDTETPESPEYQAAGFDNVYLEAFVDARFEAGDYSVAFTPVVGETTYANSIWAPEQGDRLSFGAERGVPRSIVDPYLVLVYWYAVAGNGPSIPLAPPVDGVESKQFWVGTHNNGSFSVYSNSFNVTSTAPEAEPRALLALVAAVFVARVDRRLRASEP